jgi:cyanophycinase
LQRFWNEAGAYGSRLLVIGVGKEGRHNARAAVALFEAWESESVVLVAIETRADALALDASASMEHATGVLLAGDDPLALAGVLGGTQAAQMVRRMNARSKVICALGGGASILCQHMLAGARASVAPAAGATAAAQPLLHRNLVQFAPGMGLLNRMVIDASPAGAALSLPRLLTAVAHNPFLVGVGVDGDTGVVVYPNAVMEVFGEGAALVVDGTQVGHADLHSSGADAAASLLGATVHVLAAGCTFNFDTHVAAAPNDADADADAAPRAPVSKSAY